MSVEAPSQSLATSARPASRGSCVRRYLHLRDANRWNRAFVFGPTSTSWYRSSNKAPNTAQYSALNRTVMDCSQQRSDVTRHCSLSNPANSTSERFIQWTDQQQKHTSIGCVRALIFRSATRPQIRVPRSGNNSQRSSQSPDFHTLSRDFTKRSHTCDWNTHFNNFLYFIYFIFWLIYVLKIFYFVKRSTVLSRVSMPNARYCFTISVRLSVCHIVILYLNEWTYHHTSSTI